MAGKSYGEKEIFRKCVEIVRREFPKYPEAQLMGEIVVRAMSDVFFIPWTNESRIVYSAMDYLAGDMIHAEACGVDPDYIRGVLVQSGLEEFRELANA